MKKFLTESETKREMKYKRVCNRFILLQNEYPNYKAHRLMLAIAREENMTAHGIRRILVANNVYQSK